MVELLPRDGLLGEVDFEATAAEEHAPGVSDDGSGVAAMLELARVMSQHRFEKTLVFVANGYYDLATPFFATEYTIDHLGLRDGVSKNIEVGYYDAGHMMYVNDDCAKQFRESLVKFVRDTDRL